MRKFTIEQILSATKTMMQDVVRAAITTPAGVMFQDRAIKLVEHHMKDFERVLESIVTAERDMLLTSTDNIGAYIRVQLDNVFCNQFTSYFGTDEARDEVKQEVNALLQTLLAEDIVLQIDRKNTFREHLAAILCEYSVVQCDRERILDRIDEYLKNQTPKEEKATITEKSKPDVHYQERHIAATLTAMHSMRIESVSYAYIRATIELYLERCTGHQYVSLMNKILENNNFCMILPETAGSERYQISQMERWQTLGSTLTPGDKNAYDRHVIVSSLLSQRKDLLALMYNAIAFEKSPPEMVIQSLLSDDFLRLVWYE